MLRCCVGFCLVFERYLLFSRWFVTNRGLPGVERGAEALLVEDGSGTVAWYGLVCGLLTAIPEQKIKLHGGDCFSGCIQGRPDELDSVQGTGPDLYFFV